MDVEIVLNNINEITFIEWRLTPFENKLAKEFKKKGIKTSVISIYELTEYYKQFFDESIYWLKNNEKNLNIINKIIRFFFFLKKVFKKKYSILIGVTSEENWFVALTFFLLRKKAKKRIYFPYDIAYFRYENYKTYPWYVRWSEKYNFKCCSSIIHKGPENELKYLPKEFKVVGKPSLQFLLYCDKDAMVEIDEEFFGQKLSKKDRKIHLVYVGGVYHNDKGYFNTVDSFKKIVNQKLHIHVYSQKYEQLIILPEYKKICENEYFHIHKPIYTENLQIEISRYDWGVYVFFPDFTLLKKEFIETAYGNKISTYLEAGLPIITNRTLAFASSIIEEKGFGIVVDKPEEIAEKIKDIKIEDIDKKRKMFTLNEHIGELISFIERIK